MTDAPESAPVEPGEDVEPATPATLPDDAPAAPDADPAPGEETARPAKRDA